jgi:hypothetical protein
MTDDLEERAPIGAGLFGSLVMPVTPRAAPLWLRDITCPEVGWTVPLATASNVAEYMDLVGRYQRLTKWHRVRMFLRGQNQVYGHAASDLGAGYLRNALVSSVYCQQPCEPDADTTSWPGGGGNRVR